MSSKNESLLCQLWTSSKLFKSLPSLIFIFWKWDNTANLIWLNDIYEALTRVTNAKGEWGLCTNRNNDTCTSGEVLFTRPLGIMPLSLCPVSFNLSSFIPTEISFPFYSILKAIKNKRYTCKLNVYLVHYIIPKYKIWQDSRTLLLPLFLPSDQS